MPVKEENMRGSKSGSTPAGSSNTVKSELIIGTPRLRTIWKIDSIIVQISNLSTTFFAAKETELEFEYKIKVKAFMNRSLMAEEVRESGSIIIKNEKEEEVTEKLLKIGSSITINLPQTFSIPPGQQMSIAAEVEVVFKKFKGTIVNTPSFTLSEVLSIVTFEQEYIKTKRGINTRAFT